MSFKFLIAATSLILVYFLLNALLCPVNNTLQTITLTPTINQISTNLATSTSEVNNNNQNTPKKIPRNSNLAGINITLSAKSSNTTVNTFKAPSVNASFSTNTQNTTSVSSTSVFSTNFATNTQSSSTSINLNSSSSATSNTNSTNISTANTNPVSASDTTETKKDTSIGRHFTDPDFGTKLIQVTNSSDGQSCTNAYSYWPSFNKDDTKFFLFCDNKSFLYDFDPNNFQITARHDLFPTMPSGGMPNGEDSIWSGTSNNILYAHTGIKLWRLNLNNNSYDLIKDFSANFDNKFLWQMSKSLDDNRFAFTLKDPDQDYNIIGYFVWDKTKNKIIYQINTNTLDEVQLDKSGKYLVVKTGDETKGDVRVKIVNLDNSEVTDLIYGSPDFAPGHSDNGSGILVGADDWNNSLTLRDLSNPKSFKTILSFGSDWTEASHISFLADDESWLLLSLYTPGGLKSGKYHDEIIMVSTDGSATVKELIYHHSVVNDYSDQPHADISRDGKFAIFTSNWDGTRRDVYLLKIK